VTLTGSGHGQKLSLVPPQFFYGGNVEIGETWQSEVTISNPTELMIEIYIPYEYIKVKKINSKWTYNDVTEARFDTDYSDIAETAGMVVEALTTTPSNHSPGEPDDPFKSSERSKYQIEANPQRIVLMPHSATPITIRVTSVQAIGQHEITIPVKATNPYILVDDITITTSIIGPRIRFEAPEVDVGLIGVGLTAEKILTFTNESTVPLNYMMKCTLNTNSTGA
jgi:hypothetical protein